MKRFMDFGLKGVLFLGLISRCSWSAELTLDAGFQAQPDQYRQTEILNGLQVWIEKKGDLDQRNESLALLQRSLTPAIQVLKDGSFDFDLRRLRIILKDFGNRREGNRAFFFRKLSADEIIKNEMPTVVLDSNAGVTRYWSSLLAHELTHFSLMSQNVPSWFEEGIAQINEEKAGSDVPRLRTEDFKVQDLAGVGLFDLRRPVSQPAIYPLSFLFCKFARARWGVRSYSQLDLSWMFRAFSFSLVLQPNRNQFYQIPDWSGWGKKAPRFPEGDVLPELRRGEIRIFEETDSPDAIQRVQGEGYELYRIFYWSKGFQIIEGDQVFLSEKELRTRYRLPESSFLGQTVNERWLWLRH